MKQYLLLLGGFVGFATCFATGLVAGHDIVQILLNASIGCVVGGMMFKWIAVMLVEYRLVQRKRAVVAASAAAAAAPAPAKKGAAK